MYVYICTYKFFINWNIFKMSFNINLKIEFLYLLFNLFILIGR